MRASDRYSAGGRYPLATSSARLLPLEGTAQLGTLRISPDKMLAPRVEGRRSPADPGHLANGHDIRHRQYQPRAPARPMRRLQSCQPKLPGPERPSSRSPRATNDQLLIMSSALPCHWPRAIAARGQALLADQAGDRGAAHRHFTNALTAHESIPMPLTESETRLAYGSFLRPSPASTQHSASAHAGNYATSSRRERSASPQPPPPAGKITTRSQASLARGRSTSA